MSSVLTTLLRNPTIPTTGLATGAAGATTAAVGAANALGVAVAANAFAAGTTLDSAAVAVEPVIVTTSTAPTVDTGVDDAVPDAGAASTRAACVEFDSVLAGVDAAGADTITGVAVGVVAPAASTGSLEATGALEVGWVLVPVGSVLVD